MLGRAGGPPAWWSRPSCTPPVTIGRRNQDSTNDAAVERHVAVGNDSTLPNHPGAELACGTSKFARRQQLRQKELTHWVAALNMKPFHDPPGSVAAPPLRNPAKARAPGDARLIVDQILEVITRVDHEVVQNTCVGRDRAATVAPLHEGWTLSHSQALLAANPLAFQKVQNTQPPFKKKELQATPCDTLAMLARMEVPLSLPALLRLATLLPQLLQLFMLAKPLTLLAGLSFFSPPFRPAPFLTAASWLRNWQRGRQSK